MADLYFWRQIFILTTGLLISLCGGFMTAFPSVLNPALMSPNSTDIRATSSQASWISACIGISGMIGFFVLSPILQIFGRKVVYISISVVSLIGWIIFPLANSITALFAARMIQGLGIGGIYINSLIISEYCDPKRRGYFLTLKKVGLAVGCLMCHALSMIWNWRQIATFASTLPATAMILTFFWPESPYYLAMKGRFRDSEDSFIWLRGTSNMKELHDLLTSQMNKRKTPCTEKWYKFLFRKDFVKPIMIVSLLTLILDLCGKNYFVVYVIQIMEELIGDNSTALYFSLGADFLTIIALTISCILIRYFKRRVFLFTFSITTVMLMLLICVIIVLKLARVVWLIPALILLQNFIINIGVVPVSFALIGEVLPLEHKGSSSCVNGVVFTVLYTVTIKLTIFFMETTGVESVFGIYGVSIALCLVILYFILPETKDRTLQEIEDEWKGLKSDTCFEDTG